MVRCTFFSNSYWFILVLKVAFANTDIGEMYIVPPSGDEEFSFAMVHYLMHEDGVTRSQSQVKSG